MISGITALETSKHSLQKLWEIEDGLTTEEKFRLHNTFVASLSALVPDEIWDKALSRARETVEANKENGKES